MQSRDSFACLRPGVEVVNLGKACPGLGTPAGTSGKWIGGWVEGQKDRRIEGEMNERVNGCVDCRMSSCMRG